MRRTAIATTFLALVAGLTACSPDAPTPTPPNPGGRPPSGASPLQIRLFTSNPNPTAGSCSLIQAIVTLNGANVADGTGVAFSTDFGVFAQNGLPLISVVTQTGAALTALCSDFVGLANVHASATVGPNTASATISISFQPSAQSGPFFTFCSPTSGPNTGGTTLVINGGRFPGNASTTRVTFTALGVTREGLVTAVTPTAVTVRTPSFPEAVSPSVPVNITLTFSTITGATITLTVPNCFAFGSSALGPPAITALLPSSGSKDGNTRVTIIGSGFSAPLQVFFGTVEAQVLSVSPNQIVVLTPAVFQFGPPVPVINTPIPVHVHEVASGLDSPASSGAVFKYVLPLVITGIDPTRLRVDALRPVTIFGHGFQAPVFVTIGGIAATVISVSESEILVLPGRPPACTGGGGPPVVTNLDTGESATSPQAFTYIVVTPTISSITPTTGAAGISVTITGTNLPTNVASALVRFGSNPAIVTAASADGTSLVVTVPPGSVTTAPVCPVGTAVGTPVPTGETAAVSVTNRDSGCTGTGPAFAYQANCGVADLALTKTSNPTSVAINSNVTYVLTIANIGGVPAAAVIATDTLPAGTTFVSCTPSQGTCSASFPTVTAAIGTIPATGSATVSIVARMPAVPGAVTNSASVTTTTTEINLGNNSASATTTVTP